MEPLLLQLVAHVSAFKVILKRYASHIGMQFLLQSLCFYGFPDLISVWQQHDPETLQLHPCSSLGGLFSEVYWTVSFHPFMVSFVLGFKGSWGFCMHEQIWEVHPASSLCNLEELCSHQHVQGLSRHSEVQCIPSVSA